MKNTFIDPCDFCSCGFINKVIEHMKDKNIHLSDEYQDLLRRLSNIIDNLESNINPDDDDMYVTLRYLQAHYYDKDYIDNLFNDLSSGYLLKSDFNSYADSWANGKGFLTSAALVGYATEAWVLSQLEGFTPGGDNTDKYVTGGSFDGSTLRLFRNDGTNVEIDFSDYTGGGQGGGSVDVYTIVEAYACSSSATTVPTINRATKGIPSGWNVSESAAIQQGGQSKPYIFKTQATRKVGDASESSWRIIDGNNNVWEEPICIGDGTTSGTGVDGDSYNYIYYQSNSSTTPIRPQFTVEQMESTAPDNNGNRYINGWSDHPYAISFSNQYVYVSVAKRTDGTWGSYSTPTLWSRWGTTGRDGDGVEYIYKTTTSIWSGASNEWEGGYLHNGVRITKESSDYQSDDFIPDGWHDNPQQVNPENTHLYVAVRKSSWIGASASSDGHSEWLDFSTPVLWNQYTSSSTSNGYTVTVTPPVWTITKNSSTATLLKKKSIITVTDQNGDILPCKSTGYTNIASGQIYAEVSIDTSINTENIYLEVAGNDQNSCKIIMSNWNNEDLLVPIEVRIKQNDTVLFTLNDAYLNIIAVDGSITGGLDHSLFVTPQFLECSTTYKWLDNDNKSIEISATYWNFTTPDTQVLFYTSNSTYKVKIRPADSSTYTEITPTSAQNGTTTLTYNLRNASSWNASVPEGGWFVYLYRNDVLVATNQISAIPIVTNEPSPYTMQLDNDRVWINSGFNGKLIYAHSKCGITVKKGLNDITQCYTQYPQTTPSGTFAVISVTDLISEDYTTPQLEKDGNNIYCILCPHDEHGTPISINTLKNDTEIFNLPFVGTSAKIVATVYEDGVVADTLTATYVAHLGEGYALSVSPQAVPVKFDGSGFINNNQTLDIKINSVDINGNLVDCTGVLDDPKITISRTDTNLISTFVGPSYPSNGKFSISNLYNNANLLNAQFKCSLSLKDSNGEYKVVDDEYIGIVPQGGTGDPGVPGVDGTSVEGQHFFYCTATASGSSNFANAPTFSPTNSTVGSYLSKNIVYVENGVLKLRNTDPHFQWTVDNIILANSSDSISGISGSSRQNSWFFNSTQRFLYQVIVTEYKDSTNTTVYQITQGPVCVGVWGEKGDKGDKGNDGSSSSTDGLNLSIVRFRGKYSDLASTDHLCYRCYDDGNSDGVLGFIDIVLNDNNVPYMFVGSGLVSDGFQIAAPSRKTVSEVGYPTPTNNYYRQAEQYKFIATELLIADTILSNVSQSSVYLVHNNNSSTTVSGGFSGNTSMTENTILWGGGTTSTNTGVYNNGKQCSILMSVPTDTFTLEESNGIYKMKKISSGGYMTYLEVFSGNIPLSNDLYKYYLQFQNYYFVINLAAGSHYSYAYAELVPAEIKKITNISNPKFRFNADGSGLVAGGNITWDASGNVDFVGSGRLDYSTTNINISSTSNDSLPKEVVRRQLLFAMSGLSRKVYVYDIDLWSCNNIINITLSPYATGAMIALPCYAYTQSDVLYHRSMVKRGTNNTIQWINSDDMFRLIGKTFLIRNTSTSSQRFILVGGPVAQVIHGTTWTTNIASTVEGYAAEYTASILSGMYFVREWTDQHTAVGIDPGVTAVCTLHYARTDVKNGAPENPEYGIFYWSIIPLNYSTVAWFNSDNTNEPVSDYL